MARKLFFILFCLNILRQGFAPPAESCQTVGTVSLMKGGAFPQLCNEVNGSNQLNLFCNAFDSLKESDVFCNVLGYPRSNDSGSVSTVTRGDSQNKIKNLRCNGNETKITDCSYDEMIINCVVAKGVECASCNESSQCRGGECAMNGVCLCNETCQNSGYCFVGMCICTSGFQGSDCTQCSPPCQNGGVCTVNATCQCSGTSHGQRCELAVTPSIANTTSTSISTQSVITEIAMKDLSLLLIATVTPSILCILIVVLISFTLIMVVISVVISRKKMDAMKKTIVKLSESTGANTNMSINTNVPSLSAEMSRRPEYELDYESIPNHHYYYIEAGNEDRLKGSESASYEIMHLYEDNDQKVENGNMTRTNTEKKSGGESNDVKEARHSTAYVVGNVNEL